MSAPKAVHCIVDDTALTTNISEIETWVSQGTVTLVVPLYTLERLHLLKKDASQIGSNARKAVKFLDRMTSGIEDLPHEPIVLQGPDEQYATWQEVEAHYVSENVAPGDKQAKKPQNCTQNAKQGPKSDNSSKRISNTGGALSQMLLEKLNFTEQPAAGSPASTPPMSPTSSGPQSSKTSPDVKAISMVASEISPVPPTLKPLLNPVVWYMHEKAAQGHTNLFFLTNSADTQHLARDFQVATKNIHQLRSLIGVEPDEAKGQEKVPKKVSAPSSVTGITTEPKTLFKYDDESDDEEVVFKPRGRGTSRAGGSARGGAQGSIRSKNGHVRSPRLSFSTPSQTGQIKPQIPVEEIDPDSFDRGSFGRGSTPLVNTGNHAPNQFNGMTRGTSHRSNFAPAGPSRGYRGNSRGLDRGSARGRGRLFVP